MYFFSKLFSPSLSFSHLTMSFEKQQLQKDKSNLKLSVELKNSATEGGDKITGRMGTRGSRVTRWENLKVDNDVK